VTQERISALSALAQRQAFATIMHREKLKPKHAMEPRKLAKKVRELVDQEVHRRKQKEDPTVPAPTRAHWGEELEDKLYPTTTCKRHNRWDRHKDQDGTELLAGIVGETVSHLAKAGGSPLTRASFIGNPRLLQVGSWKVRCTVPCNLCGQTCGVSDAGLADRSAAAAVARTITPVNNHTLVEGEHGYPAFTCHYPRNIKRVKAVMQKKRNRRQASWKSHNDNAKSNAKKRLKTLHKVTGLTENTPQDDVAIYRAWMQARRSSATGLEIGFHLSLHSI
jgi:hypothetical protein